MPSESALVDGGFATYSESVGAGKEVDAGAMDKFIRENIQRFGGDAVAAGRAFMEQNS
jgi:hypothetical protein